MQLPQTIACIVTSIVVVYWDLIEGSGGFLNYDDDKNYAANPHLQEWTGANFQWILQEGVVLAVYEPVANLFKLLLSTLASLDYVSIVRVNVCLHTVNAVWAYLLATRVLRMLGTSKDGKTTVPTNGCVFAATILMAVHPLRVEVLAWASCLPYLLAAMFSLISVSAHVWHRELRPFTSCQPFSIGFWRFISIVSFGLATLCKAASISVAGYILVLDFTLTVVRTRHARDKNNSNDGNLLSLLRLIGCLCLDHVILLCTAIASALLANRVHNVSQANSLSLTDRTLEPFESFLRACYMAAFYLWRTCLPSGLCPRYPVPGAEVDTTQAPFSHPAFAVAAVFVVGATALCFCILLVSWQRKHTPRPVSLWTELGAISWFAYITLLVPTLGLVGKGATHITVLAADRYCYLPSLMIGIAVTSCALARVSMTSRIAQSNAGSIFLIPVLALLALQTRAQIRVWHDSTSLWTHQLSVYPGDANAWNNIGDALHLEYKQAKQQQTPGHAHELHTRNLVDLTCQSYRSAIALNPRHADAMSNLGAAQLELGVTSPRHVEEAEVTFTSALNVNPSHANAWVNMGNVMQRLQRLSEAEAAYTTATQLNPALTQAYSNLGVVLWTRGDKDKAISTFRKAVHVNVLNDDAHTNLGLAYRVVGREDEAMASFRAAIAINRKSSAALAGLNSATS